MLEYFDENERDLQIRIDSLGVVSPEDREKLLDAGFDDLDANAIRLIEWADKGGDFVPPADMNIRFTVQNTGRMVTINALSNLGKDLFSQWHISLGEN